MGEGSVPQTGAAPDAPMGTAVVQHMPIGEVLSLLQEEFPDVTISKIRFLESQGLIQPERTASGYRRFSTGDIERLQWILRQQRDHFLPLKVIRKMLDEGVDRYDPGGPQPTLFSASVEAQADAEEDDEDHAGDDGEPSSASGDASGSAPEQRRRSPAHPAVASAPAERSAPSRPPRPAERAPVDPRSPGTDTRSQRASARPDPTSPSAPESTTPVAADAPAADAPNGPGSSSPRPPHETPADVVAALQEDPRKGRGPAPRPASRPVAPRERRSEPAEPAAALSAQELCSTADISADLLSDLERFGLVQADSRGIERGYGPDAVEVARLAARYAELGVEPRHLRMYLVAAEREAGLVEQLAVPLLKQRNPKARENASALATELAELGTELHRSLLRRELGDDLLP